MHIQLIPFTLIPFSFWSMEKRSPNFLAVAKNTFKEPCFDTLVQ